MPSLVSRNSFFRLELLDNQYPPLHGLRTLAILSILQYHATLILNANHFPIPGWFVFLSLNTFFGMDLFFILSGFLIGSMLIRSPDARGPASFLRFYGRRAFRIFPLYYCVLTALALFGSNTPEQYGNLVYEYSYLTNYVRGNVVMNWGWSLCVEEHFYLIVPALIAGLFALGSHRSRLVVLCALWLLGLAIRLWIYSGLADPSYAEIHSLLYKKTHARFDILIAGIAVAYAHHFFGGRLSSLFSRAAWRRIAWALVLGCLALLLFPFPVIGGQNHVFDVFSWGTITSVMYVPLILLLLHRDSAFGRFLSSPAFRKAATLGYGTYLVHVTVCVHSMEAAREAIGRFGFSNYAAWPMTFFLMLALSFPCAYLLHLFVEKPALSLRSRLVPSPTRGAAGGEERAGPRPAT